MSTGWEFYSDHIFLHYADSGHVQVGFSHTGYFTGNERAPCRWTTAQCMTCASRWARFIPRRRIRFLTARLPWRWLRSRAGCASRWMVTSCCRGPRFSLMVRPAVSAWAAMVSAKPSATIFSGQIISVRRGAYRGLREPRTGDGPVRLQVLFPVHPTVQNQPLDHDW